LNKDNINDYNNLYPVPYSEIEANKNAGRGLNPEFVAKSIDQLNVYYYLYSSSCIFVKNITLGEADKKQSFFQNFTQSIVFQNVPF
jgi:hypothetical protein